MNDPDYLEGLRKGDQKVINQFYRNYQPLIVNLLRRQGLPAQEAEDIFQDALLAELVRLHDQPYHDEKIHNYGAWFKRICYNHYLNYCRKNKRRANVTLETLMVPDKEISADQVLQRFTQADIIDEAFVKLSSDCQRILHLVIHEGKKGPEIAEHLNIAAAAARKRISRCRKSLRDFITNDPRQRELNE
ncbi:MAG: RNA polymerase sigma factor [Bacteroidota bacterium]